MRIICGFNGLCTSFSSRELCWTVWIDQWFIYVIFIVRIVYFLSFSIYIRNNVRNQYHKNYIRIVVLDCVYRRGSFKSAILSLKGRACGRGVEGGIEWIMIGFNGLCTLFLPCELYWLVVMDSGRYFLGVNYFSLF